MTAITAAENADRGSSSWHDYHLYETFERLLYLKVSIREAASDALRVRFEWNLLCNEERSQLLLKIKPRVNSAPPQFTRHSQRLQHHNSRLLKLIERAERRLSAVAQKAASEVKQIEK